MNNYPYISIIGRRECDFTQRAIDACHDNATPYVVQYVTNDKDAQNAKARYQHFTFPIVTIRHPFEEEYIGGSDNLIEYFAERNEETYSTQGFR